MKIFLTRGAENNYRSICRYLTEKWSEAVAAAFENKVIDFLKVLDSYKIFSNHKTNKSFLQDQEKENNYFFFF